MARRRTLDLERVKEALATLLPEAAGEDELHLWCRKLFGPRSSLRFVLAGAARGLISPNSAQLWAIERLLLYGFGRPRTLIEVKGAGGRMVNMTLYQLLVSGVNPDPQLSDGRSPGAALPVEAERVDSNRA